MELVKVNTKPALPEVAASSKRETSDIHFMAANTNPVSLGELQKRHTIPVFAKDNESTISHQEFIETVALVTEKIFGGETILKPAVRVSHPIKGRIPSAVGMPAKELLEHEKTLYYERMAFAIEVNSIYGNIASNALNLTVGGVRATILLTFIHARLRSILNCSQGSRTRYVCTNLCISTDGFKSEGKVRTIAELAKAAYNLFGEFNAYKNIDTLNNLPGTMLTESKFAQIIGRAKL